MSGTSVNYTAPLSVAAMLRSNAPFRCIMGPLGSGKSSGCNIELLLRAKRQRKGPDGIRRTRWAVVRNTYGQLRDTTQKTFERWIPAGLGEWNKTAFSFHMKFDDVDAEILFRALNRPEDIKKLLSLDLTGAYVNEAREVPIAILDGLDGRVGRFPPMADGGPTWFGVWADTNPWHTRHPLALRFQQNLPGYELFRQPGGRSEDAENTEHLPPGYYERLCIGKPSDWVRVYVDGEEASADIGSIYGDLIDLMDKRGATQEFEHGLEDVFTTWDLGISDSTAIWWWRVHDGGAEFVDHYESHGKPLSHFFDIIDERAAQRGYTYVKHWLPHDARARTLITGSSILEQCAERWGANKVDIAPKLSLLDGIQATRWLFEQPGTRFHSRTEAGINCLREYRYEWDENERSWSKRPLHNFASHSADAARYVAIVFRHTDAVQKAPKPTPKPAPKPGHTLLTFDELVNDYRARHGGRERI